MSKWNRPRQELIEIGVTLATMGCTLRAEGWVPTFTDDLEQCFWHHEPSGMSVNSNGGHFCYYEVATNRAYESQTRELLPAS